MAWEWSQSAEAYDNVHLNIIALDRNDLAVILTEWLVYMSIDSLKFDNTEKMIKGNKFIIEDDAIAESIWKLASSYEFGRTCDNGGFNAWVCPHGCHTVPFDRMEDDNG